jgi:PAS domain-containing protein
MAKQLEEYLRTTLASIGDAVISTDAEGRIVFVNKAVGRKYCRTSSNARQNRWADDSAPKPSIG